jgi:hypothetical protein
MAAAAHLAFVAALGQTSSSDLSTRHEAYDVQPAWRRATCKGQLGLEIERTLPGDVRATRERDNVSRSRPPRATTTAAWPRASSC